MSEHMPESATGPVQQFIERELFCTERTAVGAWSAPVRTIKDIVKCNGAERGSPQARSTQIVVDRALWISFKVEI